MSAHCSAKSKAPKPILANGVITEPEEEGAAEKRGHDSEDILNGAKASFDKNQSKRNHFLSGN